MSTNITQAYHIQVEEKIPIHVIHSDFSNFMVSSSKLSLLKVLLKVNKKTWMSTNITPAYHIQVEKNPSDVINPDFSDLPGLLLQVVLAVHSVVDHQLTYI